MLWEKGANETSAIGATPVNVTPAPAEKNFKGTEAKQSTEPTTAEQQPTEATEPTRQPSQAEGTAQAGTAGKGREASERGIEDYQVSNEKDENGHPFVLSSDGKLEFGYITADTGLAEAPILLSEGLITDSATNAGYGLILIEARHGKQIREAGDKSVIEFIEAVARNYDVIKEGKDRVGNQTYLLQLTDKHNNTLIVELSGDSTYWNINTAGIFKTSYGAKRKVVYNRHTTVKQPAEATGVSLTEEQGDTTTETSMDTPTQEDTSYTSKGSEQAGEKQDAQQEKTSR